MFLFRPFRLLAQSLVIDATPRAMGLGAALGVLVGLVPKGNLLAAALMMPLCALRVNLGIGLATAFVVSWIGLFLDPISHSIGLAFLQHVSLQPLWAKLYDLPVVPWTDFNNTIVLGSFVLGLALFGPVYFVSRPVFAAATPKLSAWAKRFHLTSVFWGGEMTGKVS